MIELHCIAGHDDLAVAEILQELLAKSIKEAQADLVATARALGLECQSRASVTDSNAHNTQGLRMGIKVRVRVGVEWINNFHSDACQQADLSYCDNQAEGFFNTMGDNGHTKVFDWGNDNAWETDFRHPDFGGDSLNWSDDVHFCLVNDHGGNWDNTANFAFSKAHDNCMVSTTQMRLGRKNLKWIAALGCDAVLNTNADHIVAVWGGPMQGVHIVCGFIGTAADSWWSADLGEDFADDICDGDSIAGSWVSRAYSWWTGDDSIAIAAGETQDDAVRRRDHETLDWRDNNVGATRWLAWKYRT